MSDVAILILSCDKYADAWESFFLMFEKFWSDCPFTIYLTSNEKPFVSEKVKLKINQLFSNKHSTWSEETFLVLKEIKEEYVILLLEDYLIYQNVDTQSIMKYYNVMLQENALYLRLACFPKKYNSWWPYQPITKEYAVISYDAKYLISLQTSIWKKDFLLQLIEDNESPWEFEINGSNRARHWTLENPNRFLCLIEDKKKHYVHGPITYYCTGITNGKWERGAISLLKKNGIEITSNTIKIKNVKEHILHRFYIFLPIPLRKLWDFLEKHLS